jgi:hypothetical protein
MSKALTDLLAKVELGQFVPRFDGPEHFVWPGMEDGNAMKRHHLRYAYHGSLDAAKALHEVVLSGWDIQITTYEDDSFEASVAYPLRVKTYDGISSHMSRAWLIAILKALIAKGQTND